MNSRLWFDKKTFQKHLLPKARLKNVNYLISCPTCKQTNTHSITQKWLYPNQHPDLKEKITYTSISSLPAA